MKKLTICVMSVFVLLSLMAVCYAGSIPEDLLSADSAQVYFGEIKKVDKESITVIHYQNIKGNFYKDSEHTYTKFIFTDSPEVGKLYLCGYFDKNNPLYVWEVTSLDTKTLEIKNNDDMSKRMQEYLNDGKFEEAEQKRLTKAVSGMSPQTPESNDGALQTSTETLSGRNLLVFSVVSGSILAGLILMLWMKRKPKR